MSEGMIHKQMVAIMRETDAIGKTERNEAQRFMFRGIDQVYNELHPVFARNGVFIVPTVQDHKHFEETTAKGGKMHHHFVLVDFTFTAEDGSSVTMRGMGEAADSGDKGVNKCLSIALKYALFQSLLIPTEEEKDPDASGYQTAGRKRKAAEEPDPPGVQRNSPEQQKEYAQQRVAEVKGEKAAPKVDYTILKAFGEIKKHIGEDEYYAILDGFGYKKSSEIETTERARAVYRVMGARKKAMDDAKEGEALLVQQPAPKSTNAALGDPK